MAFFLLTAFSHFFNNLSTVDPVMNFVAYPGRNLINSSLLRRISVAHLLLLVTATTPRGGKREERERVPLLASQKRIE